MIFIGPPAAAIRAMGDKAQAKALMAEAGVPLVPGYHGDRSKSGGPRRKGRGPRLSGLDQTRGGRRRQGNENRVLTRRSFAAALASAKREALSAFGDGRVLLEKYLPRARHVEVQIFADPRQNCVHLFDRDCSIQRRHQKIIEEAPAPGLSDPLRQAMREAALSAARAIGYVGAGTVEFLFSPHDGAFYFLEMNTRLQVEHPVTEMITGIDLVEWQILVAAGGTLPLRQEAIAARGHAIEARIYAEDPARDFLPQSGRLARLDFPDPGPHLRVDAGVRAGDTIPVDYDPMIAKLIVWGEDRQAAVRRLAAALAETRIAGLAANVDFLRAIAAEQAFAEALLDTGFLERHGGDLLAPIKPATHETLAMAVIGLLCERAAATRGQAQRIGRSVEPVEQPEGLAAERAGARNACACASFCRKGAAITPSRSPICRTAGALAWPKAAFSRRAAPSRRTDRSQSISTVIVSGVSSSAPARRSPSFQGPGLDIVLAWLSPIAGRAGSGAPPGRLVAPMPGRIAALLVEPGARVDGKSAGAHPRGDENGASPDRAADGHREGA